MKKILVQFLVIVFGLSFACNEEKCGNFPTSSLTFEYSGFLNGTFSVLGEIPSSNISDHNWAMGGYFSEGGTEFMVIRAILVINSGFQQIAFYIPNAGVGKYNLPGRYGTCSPDPCDHLSFYYEDSSQPDLGYLFLSGEVNITYSECDRIGGTFNGIIKDVTSSNTMEIANGEFDVHTQCLWC